MRKTGVLILILIIVVGVLYVSRREPYTAPTATPSAIRMLTELESEGVREIRVSVADRELVTQFPKGRLVDAHAVPPSRLEYPAWTTGREPE